MSGDLRHDRHEPTDACWRDHCYIHDVDEPGDGAYLACGECFHVYPTKRDLRRAYRRGHPSLRDDWRRASWLRDDDFTPSRLTMIRWWLRLRLLRASRIYFCPECSHDF